MFIKLNRLKFNGLTGLTFIIMLFFFVFGSFSSLYGEEGEVKLTADRLIYDQDNKTITLTGNVRFTHKNTVLSGSRAVFDTETQKGKISGGVKIQQPDFTIEGIEMEVFYNEKTAILKGNVKMVSISDVSNTSGGSQEDFLSSGVTTLTCSLMTYNWLTRQGEAEGSIFIEQKDRRAYSEKAHYNGVLEIITLEDRVRFEQGSNNWVTCQKAYLDLRRETFMASGAVTGNFLIQEGLTGPEEDEIHQEDASKWEDKLNIPDLPFKERHLPD